VAGEDVLVVRDLVKRYPGGVLALRGISFRVRRGEIFGFLGPNGAGKTTTIHVLATLLKPTAGKAIVAGYDVVREPVKVRRSIGIVFQDPSLDDQLTAWENMYIHGRVYGLKGRVLEERIGELLRFVELYEHRNRPVKYFSGGMRRRL
jgi:ABC-2 type transport system ATP-binding protein